MLPDCAALRWSPPERSRRAQDRPFCSAPSDASIFASAIIARPDIVLSNDFQAFHTPQAKAFWKEHGIAVESLYGLLCVFGWREQEE